MTQNSKLAQRYAKALFDLAREANLLISLHEKLRLLASALEGHSALFRALAASFYSKAEQEKLVAAMLRGISGGTTPDASIDMLDKFLKLLIKKGRLAYVLEIIQAFKQLMLEHQNLVKIELRSAVNPTDGQKNELLALLKTILKKDILLNIKIDKSLLGGFIVKFGSYQIDTSILTKLSSLKLALKEGN